MEITRYSDTYKTQTIELLKDLYPGMSKQERTKIFEWHYENNPYNARQFLYIALDKGQVVGFRGNVLNKFTVNDKIINVFMGADAIVHPGYRRYGIFSKLIAAFVEDINELFSPDSCVILALSANALSARGNLKQGYKQTKGIKKNSYRFSLLNYLKVKLFNKRPSRQSSTIQITKNKLLYEINYRFPVKDISSFLNSNRIKDKISNIRDIDFFLWRYSESPETYTCVTCRKNLNLIGYMIIKHTSNFQSVIEEYFSLTPQALRTMVNIAVKQLVIPVLRTQVLTKQEHALLQKSGLIIEPDWLLKLLRKERQAIFVRSIRPIPEEQDYIINGLDLKDINNWQIYLSDRH